MATVVSSYCTKVIGEEKIFRETIAVYSNALSFLIKVVLAEWDNGIGEVYHKSREKVQGTASSYVAQERYPENRRASCTSCRHSYQPCEPMGNQQTCVRRKRLGGISEMLLSVRSLLESSITVT